MLEAILLQNFQKHEKLKIDLSHSITTITGSSDAGKSSILRAIRWCSLNNPQGDAFIRHGSPGCTVQLILDGGQKIGRRRGGADNAYVLGENKFVAFGTNVPDPIAKILNVGERNFQGQHDPVFWFSCSAGEVSRQLNSVVDLDIIDIALANVAQQVRQAQTKAQLCKDRLTKAQQEKELLAWVEEANTEYQQIEAIEADKAKIGALAGRLRQVVQSIAQADDTRQKAQEMAEDSRAVGLLGVAAQRANDRVVALGNLVSLVKKYKEVVDKGVPDVSELEYYEQLSRAYREKGNKLRTRIQEAEYQKGLLDQGVPDLGELEEIQYSYTKMDLKAKALRHKIGVVKQAEFARMQLDFAAELAQEELDKSSDGVCPICGKVMVEDACS